MARMMETTRGRKKGPIPLFTLFFVCFLIYWLPIMGYWIISLWDLRLNLTGRILFEILVAMIFIWVVRNGIDRPKKLELGLSGEHPTAMVGLGFGMLSAVFLAWIFVAMILAALRIDFGDSELDRTPEMFLFVVILGPLWEELIYRVNALTLLSRRYRPMQASFIVAVWFIAKHFLQWYNSGTSAELVIVDVIFSIFAWTIVNYLFLKYRSIIIPLVFHMGWNLMAFLTGPLFALFAMLLMVTGMIFFAASFEIMNRINSLTGKKGIQFESTKDLLEHGLILFRSLIHWEKGESLFLSVFMMVFLVLATEPLQIVIHSDFQPFYFCIAGFVIVWTMCGYPFMNLFRGKIDEYRLWKWKPIVQIMANDGRKFYYSQYALERYDVNEIDGPGERKCEEESG